MSLLNRRPISIGRAQRTLRDDRVFVVATDDSYAPAQYFEHLHLPRVRILVLSTPVNSGLSAPVHVVDRLKDAFANVKRRGEIQIGDEFWVLLDTDHHFRDRNLPGTLQALQEARQAGLEVAVSNPCFELWLLLHH
jgi:GT2 family glycosyltransferase